MNTFQKHFAAIEAGAITKANVIGIRRALNNASRIANGWSANRCAVTPDQAYELEDTVTQRAPRVTGELHDGGLKVLRNKRYAKRWTPWQVDAIAAADHFRLVGFEYHGRRQEYATPVYELWAKIPAKGDALDGGVYQAFRFINIPWQSGGNGPEVVS